MSYIVFQRLLCDEFGDHEMSHPITFDNFPNIEVRWCSRCRALEHRFTSPYMGMKEWGFLSRQSVLGKILVDHLYATGVL
jgi:hypothetical protein